MKLFQRIKFSITSGVETLLNQVENHDAVAEAVIAESREALARAEVRAEGLRRDIKELDRQRDELEKKESSWTERAKRVADSNRADALECLRRREQTTKQREQIESQIREQEDLLHELDQDLNTARQKVGELIRKRSALSVRENCSVAGAKAREATRESDSFGIFERWEEKVRTAELVGDLQRSGTPGKDRFEEKIAAKEETTSLEAELDTLLKSVKPSADSAQR